MHTVSYTWLVSVHMRLALIHGSLFGSKQLVGGLFLGLVENSGEVQKVNELILEVAVVTS